MKNKVTLQLVIFLFAKVHHITVVQGYCAYKQRHMLHINCNSLAQ